MSIYTDFEYGMDFSLTSQQKKGGGGNGTRKGSSGKYHRKQKQEQKKRQSENAPIYSSKHVRLSQQKNISINSKNNKKMLKKK